MTKFIPPPVVADGDYWSAADHNIFVADNFAVGFGGLAGAKGDILVGTDYQDGGVLAVGADYDTLRANPNAALGVEWSHEAPGAEVANGSGQTVASSSSTPVVQELDCPAVLRDPLEMWDSNSKCFVVPANVSGLWVLAVSGWLTSSVADAGKLIQIGFRVLATGQSISGYRYRSSVLNVDGRAAWITDCELAYLASGDRVWAIMTHQLSAAVSVLDLRFSLEMAR